VKLDGAKLDALPQNAERTLRLLVKCLTSWRDLARLGRMIRGSDFPP
jgi:hypothetical protein